MQSKAWIHMDGVPVLVKRGNFGDYAEGKKLLSANEVAAFRVAKEMGEGEYAPPMEQNA